MRIARIRGKVSWLADNRLCPPALKLVEVHVALDIGRKQIQAQTPPELRPMLREDLLSSAYNIGPRTGQKIEKQRLNKSNTYKVWFFPERWHDVFMPNIIRTDVVQMPVVMRGAYGEVA